MKPPILSLHARKIPESGSKGAVDGRWKAVAAAALVCGGMADCELRGEEAADLPETGETAAETGNHAASGEPQAEQTDGTPSFLEELIVIGTKTARPWIDSNGSVSSYTMQDLVREGANDAGSIAKYDPLVSAPFDFSSSDALYGYGWSGYSGFNIRGAEGNRISLELDGIRLPPQYISTSFDMGRAGGSGGMGRDYFDPASFQLVELLKGGGSALYGSDAMGGVVTMQTLGAEDLLGGRDWGSLVRAQAFSVNDSIAGQVGGAVREGDWRFLLFYAGRTGHETENHGGSLKPNPVDFSSHNVLAKADYTAGEHHYELTLESFRRDTDVDAQTAVRDGFAGAGFNDFVKNRQEMERHRASLKWRHDPASAWWDQLESHLYWQGSRSESDNHSASQDQDWGGVIVEGNKRRQTIRFDTDLAGGSFQLKRRMEHGAFRHSWLLGWEGSVEASESRFSREQTGDIPAARNRTPFAPADTWRTGGYVQDEIQWGKRWFATPGLRVDAQWIQTNLSQEYRERLEYLQNGRTYIDLTDEYENVALSPRFDLAYKPTPGTRIYGTYARGIRNPTAEELSMVFIHEAQGPEYPGSVSVPNPDLKEETSDSFEIGFKADGAVGRFQAAGFYTQYRDFIENNRFTGELDEEGREISMTVNRGESVIYGFELGGDMQLGYWSRSLEGWSVGLHTGKAIGNNRTDDQPLNSVEPWKTSAAIGYDDPLQRFGLRLTGTYVAAVTRTDDTVPETGVLFRPPSYWTLDLSGYWRPTEHLSIQAGVNNLLDEKYWTWSSGRRTAAAYGARDRSTAPGMNAYLSITHTF